MLKRYIDTATLAAQTDMSVQAYKDMRKRGSGPPYVRIGRSVRYCLDDVQKWLDEHTVTAA